MRLLVELCHVTPRIWRQLIVPAAVPLDALHDILQVAFGWTNSHLHDFSVGDVRFGVADIEDELLVVDERAAPLGAVALEGSTLVYRYDFGDDWEHQIRIEAVEEPKTSSTRVVCLAGARRCPLEDCGGAPGYENLIRVLGDPNDEEHADLKRWAGRAFDPEKFELEKVNKQLGVIARRLEKALRGGGHRRR